MVLVWLVFCTVLLVGVAIFLASIFGSGTLVWLGFLAMIPLGLCLLGLRWVDRWDPEPRIMLVLALFWGAGASVAGALLVGDTFTEMFFEPAGVMDLDLFGAVIQAPVVEELTKGAGVLLVFWLNRSHFDGPVDGIVYGGMVGAGFAFTENILYLAPAMSTRMPPGSLPRSLCSVGSSPPSHMSCSPRGPGSPWACAPCVGIAGPGRRIFCWD